MFISAISTLHMDNQLAKHCTEVCRLVGTNSQREFAHARNFECKIPPKVCACADSRRKFVPTNLQTSVVEQVHRTTMPINFFCKDSYKHNMLSGLGGGVHFMKLSHLDEVVFGEAFHELLLPQMKPCQLYVT